MWLASDRNAFAAAVVIAAVATGLTIRLNTFVAWGTDSSAYLDAAAQWASSDLFHPTSFMFWSSWSLEGVAEAPFGRVPGTPRGTLVSGYPPGYPLLLGGALRLGGPLAPHLVAPVALGILAWCAYLLASRLATPWAGVGASLLIASTPVAVYQVLTPMSDVPAAALWALAWVMALRPGPGAALASGCSVALAVLIRPNLAPLAMVLAATVIAAPWRAPDRWVRFITFGMASAIGPAILLWTQAVLYGSPFRAGYPGAEMFFRLERIPTNAVHYPAMLIDLHGWLALGGLLLIPLSFRLKSTGPSDVRPSVVAIGALGIIGINYAVLLPYFTFDGWYWLRFLLPGLLALFILLAATVDQLRILIATRSRLLAMLAWVPVFMVVTKPLPLFDLTSIRAMARVSMMGHYLRDALPTNAVVLTSLQSGAVAFYTGLPVVRLDALAPDALDRIIDHLTRTGHHPVLIVDEAMEASWFRERYVSSTYRWLDWPPRAEFWAMSPMLYLDPADRERYLNGEPYPTDILTMPVGASHRSFASALPAQGIPMPRADEARAFRRTLDLIYRDRLGRAAATAVVAPDQSVRYTLRYLRYRIYACSHEQAVTRVFTQIDRREIADVCGRITEIVFPPWDQVVDFRRQLDAKYRERHSAEPTLTHVDLEGEAVWLQEYLRYRLSGCTAEDATTRVLEQIGGKGALPGCSSRSGTH